MTEQQKTTDEVTYKATLTLQQRGMDGDVFLDLQFAPEINADNVKNMQDIAPRVYQMMSELACHYLYLTGFVDENGDLTDGAGTRASIN